MLIGAMNHPGNDVLQEIEWMAAMELDFLDLTLEPPAAASWRIDPHAIRAALERHGMRVVGHTAFYLPMGSAFEDIRRASVCELRRCLELFSAVGARWMNLHPDRHAPMHGRPFFIEQNIRSFRELLPDARRLGVGLMIENLPGDYNNAAQLGELFDELPELGLHLDIGHANLEVPFNTAEEILRAYGDRLRHVHLHDNRGGHADLHLPLGAGSVDVRRAVRALRGAGYDGTITLEVFTSDRHYLAYSRDVLRRIWDEEEAATR
ncbi:MAG TPA: sugar phosphate isomerase/epimerase family protein [Bryobacteraceae bacterium]|nr:sugar phosphate isomerase/epimerase family protein [Bryobacteraceae bacterium]